jgi:glutathione S-transferase
MVRSKEKVLTLNFNVPFFVSLVPPRSPKMTILPSSLKLTYFDIAGLAEAIRLACFVGGLEFEDERLNFEQFAKLKDTFPFKQVPILTINENIVVAQSNAILRYVGNLASLYPKNDILEAAFVDQILAHLYDFGTYVRPTYGIQDEKERIAARQ